MGVRLEVKTRGNPGDYSLWSLTKYVFNGCPLTTITTYHWPHFPCLSLWLLASIASYYMMWKWLLALSHLVLGASLSHIIALTRTKVIHCATVWRFFVVCVWQFWFRFLERALTCVWEKRSVRVKCVISANKKKKEEKVESANLDCSF